MFDILQKLVELPTVSSDRAVNEVALDYIEDFLARRGMHTKRFMWQGHGSLVATTRPTKTPTVMFAGHIDVVPADPSQFVLRQENGRIYGRGVVDMKSAIAAYLQLIDDIKDELGQYDIGIMITTDEEVGNGPETNGSSYILSQGYRSKVCVLPDGGSNWQLETRSKGAYHFDLTTSGKSAHGSRPWEGENAISKLLGALRDIQELFANEGPLTSTHNIGTISGGQATNQIAESARVAIDVRYMEPEDLPQLQAELGAIAARHGAELREQVIIPPQKNELSNPWIASFRDSIESVTGIVCTGTMSYGGGDARYFNELNIPCAIFYPPGSGHHGAEEWIEASALPLFREILADYIAKTARVLDGHVPLAH